MNTDLMAPLQPGQILIEGLELGATGKLWCELHLHDGTLVRIRLSATKPSYGTESCTFAPYLIALLKGMPLEKFPFPYKLAGTPFQSRVWHFTLKIPAGSTITYGELANRLGCNCPRAVGQALGRNPLPIVVPCHRVVGQGGRLTGFSSGVHIKQLLLKYEQEVNRDHEDCSNE